MNLFRVLEHIVPFYYVGCTSLSKKIAPGNSHNDTAKRIFLLRVVEPRCIFGCHTEIRLNQNRILIILKYF